MKTLALIPVLALIGCPHTEQSSVIALADAHAQALRSGPELPDTFESTRSLPVDPREEVISDLSQDTDRSKELPKPSEAEPPVTPPELLFLTAEWCQYCPKVKATLDRIGASYTALNFDTNRHVASQYGVSAIPAVIRLSDGKVLTGTHVESAYRELFGIPQSGSRPITRGSTQGQPKNVIDGSIPKQLDPVQKVAPQRTIRYYRTVPTRRQQRVNRRLRPGRGR